MPDLDEELAVALDEALGEHNQTGQVDVTRLRERHARVADELPGLLQALHDLDTAVQDWKNAPTPGDAAAPAGDEPLPERIGRYRILARLGAGGMGTVYRAEDPELQRVVAVKAPRFEGAGENRRVRIQRFLREARVAAKIRHPHVCPIYDVGEENGVLYVVMQCIEGPSLAERLHGRQRIENEAEAVELARQVAEALAAVHAHGIVHRDLKPGNILLAADGNRQSAFGQKEQPAGSSVPIAESRPPIAVLTDFGLARPEDDAEHLTTEGTLPGTPAYMAPEQAEGRADQIGPWTDLYSLGVVLYQALTGRLPFEGPVLTILRKIGQETPSRPSTHRPELNPALEAIVLKALAPRPADRFQSAAEFVAALQEMSTSPGSTTRRRPAPALPTRRWRARRRLLIAAAIIIGIGLAWGAYWGAKGQGTLVIATDDPAIRVVVKQGEREVAVVDADSDFEIRLPVGEYELALTGAPKELKLSRDRLKLTRRGRETVHVSLDWAAAGIQWKKRTMMPVPRSELMLAEHDGSIYVIGGAQFGSMSAVVEVYDPVADRWEARKPLPSGRKMSVDTRTGPAQWRMAAPRWNSALVTLENKLYLLGGWAQWVDANSGQVKQHLPADTLLIGDLRSGEWSLGPAIPFPEFKEGMPGSESPVAGVIAGKLYLYSGGIGSNEFPGSYFHVYDPAAERWESQPAPVGNHKRGAGAVIDGKLYLVGGCTRDDEPNGSLEFFNPSESRTSVKGWRRGKPMPTPRSVLAAVAVGGKLFAIGGARRTESLDTVEIYDPATDTWTQGPSLPSPRFNHAAVAVGNTIYVFGGHRSDTPPLAEVLTLDVTELLKRLAN